jgi:hypothetical protein
MTGFFEKGAQTSLGDVAGGCVQCRRVYYQNREGVFQGLFDAKQG